MPSSPLQACSPSVQVPPFYYTSAGNDTVIEQMLVANSCCVCPELGWAPWLKTRNRGELQMKKLGRRHLSLWKSLLFSHSGSSDLPLFGLSFSYLFPVWFFLHFLKGLVSRRKWYFIWSEREPSVFDSLFQNGTKIIYSLVFVQHSSKRP